MSDGDLCLAIDLGTGGPKIGLVASSGEVIASEVHHVETHYGVDGEATQDAQGWWDIILGAGQRLISSDPSFGDRVVAVAVTGLYASTVPVDESGIPTAPCFTWLDTRGRKYSKKAIGGMLQGYNVRKVLAFIRKTAGSPAPSGADPVGHILYLQNESPDIFAKTRWFMEPIDYLTMRFTGVASATHASRLAMWMTDIRHLDRYEYDEKLLKLVGLDGKFFPPLRPFGAVVGEVTSEVASQLGLRRTAIVTTGIPDIHAAAIGTGATKNFETHIALSTTSWISCTIPRKKTDITHSIAAIPGLSNNSYMVIDSQDTGAKALEWFQSVLASSGQTMTFDEMTSLAATSPAGSNGVLFTPWLAGERSPIGNKNIRAGFSNLSLTTTTADMVRAVMEGVAANSAWLFGYVEKFTGEKLTPVRLIGGGAQSTLWCQIFADTLGRDVVQVPEPLLAQLSGAALLAFASLGGQSVIDAPVDVGGTVFHPSTTAGNSHAKRLPSLYKRDKNWMRSNQKTSRTSN